MMIVRQLDRWSEQTPIVQRASSKSPENYVGHQRTEHFASPAGAEPDQARVYLAPSRLALNQWALAGEWTMGSQATVLNKPEGRIHGLDVDQGEIEFLDAGVETLAFTFG